VFDESFKFEISKDKNDTFIVIDIEEFAKITVKITTDKNSSEVDIRVNAMGAVVRLNIKDTSTEENGVINGTTIIDFNLNFFGERIEVKIIADYNMSSPATPLNINTSNAINIENLSEEDIEAFMEKLMEIELLAPLFGEFIDLFGSSDSDPVMLGIQASFISNIVQVAYEQHLIDTGQKKLCWSVDDLIADGYLSTNDFYIGSVLITENNNRTTTTIWLGDGFNYFEGVEDRHLSDLNFIQSGPIPSFTRFENCGQF